MDTSKTEAGDEKVVETVVSTMAGTMAGTIEKTEELEVKAVNEVGGENDVPVKTLPVDKVAAHTSSSGAPRAEARSPLSSGAQTELLALRGEILPMTQVLDVPDDLRNPSWENQFFQALSVCNLEVFSQEPQTGPDGWPYLLTKTDDSAAEPFQKIMNWLSDKGIGLVINPQKEYPDYVFTYGMIWSFKETGFFFRQQSSAPEGVFEFQVRDIKSAGEPNEVYFPSYARKILRDFFQQQGVLMPKILSFTLDGLSYELAFSTESLGQPDQSEHQGILEAIGWFLPPHYQICLLSEVDLPIPFVLL